MKRLKIIMAGSLLAAAGFSGVVSAHDYLGTLGAAATATDKYYLVCAAGTAKLTYQVQRTFGTGNLSIEGAKAGATVTPPPVASISSGTAFSPVKTMTGGGAGAYFFTVKKSPASGAARGWRARIHCYDANGQHNPDDQPTTVTYTQNQ